MYTCNYKLRGVTIAITEITLLLNSANNVDDNIYTYVTVIHHFTTNNMIGSEDRYNSDRTSIIYLSLSLSQYVDNAAQRTRDFLDSRYPLKSFLHAAASGIAITPITTVIGNVVTPDGHHLLSSPRSLKSVPRVLAAGYYSQ